MEKNCTQCGIIFEVKKPSQYIKRKFCSPNCYHASKLGKPSGTKGKKFGPMPKETKEKIVATRRLRGSYGTWKGKHFSKEHKMKIRESRLGSKNPMFGKHHSDKTKEKLSLKNIGKKMQKTKGSFKSGYDSRRGSFKKGQPSCRKGKWRFKIQLGKRPKNDAIDKLWREAVFKKYDWTCQICLRKGSKLNAHHILPYAKFPEYRYCINNGITLCEHCHNNLHGRRCYG